MNLLSKFGRGKNKIPRSINDGLTTNIFFNLLIAIFIMIYFTILNYCYTKYDKMNLVLAMKLLSFTFMIISLVFLEIAYKKENGKVLVHSLELLVLASHALSIMHVITVLRFNFNMYILTSSYMCAIYYVLKCIVIYTRERKKYLDSLSDISDIVKKDEPLKKEARKKDKKTEKIETKKEEFSISKVNPRNNTKEQAPKRKRGRPKKEVKKHD